MTLVQWIISLITVYCFLQIGDVGSVDYKLDRSLCICTDKNIGDAKAVDDSEFSLLSHGETYTDAVLYDVDSRDAVDPKEGLDYVFLVGECIFDEFANVYFFIVKIKKIIFMCICLVVCDHRHVIN